MTTTLYSSDTWHVATSDGATVRFKRASHSGRSIKLNKLAHWTGSGWDPAVWVPGRPDVPHEVLSAVRAALVRLQSQERRS